MAVVLQPTSLQLVPPVMVLLAKHPKVAEYDLSSVKKVICGAAPLSKEIEDAVKNKLNLQCVFQGQPFLFFQGQPFN